MAPQAVGVGVVLPEIVHPAGPEARRGDPVLSAEDGPGLGQQGPVAGIAVQPGLRLGVLRFHPGHGPLPVHLFQPLEGIGRPGPRGAGGGLGRLGLGGGGDQKSGAEQGKQGVHAPFLKPTGRSVFPLPRQAG